MTSSPLADPTAGKGQQVAVGAGAAVVVCPSDSPERRALVGGEVEALTAVVEQAKGFGVHATQASSFVAF